MPTINVKLAEGDRSFSVDQGVKLVLALAENGIDISYRCGGNGKCTTCACDISSGEPTKMTQVEKDKNLLSGRLSCQVLVENDMTVKPLKRVKDNSWDAPGKTPSENITPEPVWV